MQRDKKFEWIYGVMICYRFLFLEVIYHCRNGECVTSVFVYYTLVWMFFFLKKLNSPLNLSLRCWIGMLLFYFKKINALCSLLLSISFGVCILRLFTHTKKINKLCYFWWFFFCCFFPIVPLISSISPFAVNN
jgi:hypothetical protein